MKAIEAGARAILERTKVTSLDDADGLATLVIEAAIASGELVPASANNSALADELDGWHDCADGDVSAGNGHFRLQCVSDSDQQRLNLRATLREAAKALRSMVPASAVAAERERCAKVADKKAAALLATGERLSVASQATKLAYTEVDLHEQAGVAIKGVAVAIRALSPELASGEFVVVPRVPTEAMILAGHHQIDWGRDDQQTHVPEHPSQQHDGVGTTCKQDICDAWTAMLNAATKDGERK